MSISVPYHKSAQLINLEKKKREQMAKIVPKFTIHYNLVL